MAQALHHARRAGCLLICLAAVGSLVSLGGVPDLLSKATGIDSNALSTKDSTLGTLVNAVTELDNKAEGIELLIAPLVVVAGVIMLQLGNRRGTMTILTALGVLAVTGTIQGIVA
jgi:hypothetical protein